ncbi:dynein heavy chain [Entomophthora muscae]|uniref:Dynein heavy chain n=1 Tax=Entomophthora muscae TaxID=34485 RepID=A0ACC2SZJ1_9FUNG|nr:dynein heavy chain [Entomophthora muscae]
MWRSRVTFVNFTVTRGSLQSQYLNKVLKTESPATDQSVQILVKLPGEFRLRLSPREVSAPGLERIQGQHP